MKVMKEKLIEVVISYADSLSKSNISAFNEKIFCCLPLFTIFLRLQIYEAIADIFWQSASYVFLWVSETGDNQRILKIIISRILETFPYNLQLILSNI